MRSAFAPFYRSTRHVEYEMRRFLIHRTSKRLISSRHPIREWASCQSGQGSVECISNGLAAGQGIRLATDIPRAGGRLLQNTLDGAHD